MIAGLPFSLLQWMAAGVGAMACGAHLVRNLWPALRASTLNREQGLLLVGGLTAAQFFFLLLLFHAHQH